jgi:hypothetical protein
MARTYEEYSFGYKDLQELTGLSLDNLYQFKTRGDFDPESLGSVFLFLCRHARLELRKQAIDYMLNRELLDKPGLSQKRRRSRKATK